MPVAHGHAVALGAHDDRRLLDSAVAERPQELARLPLDLVLLTVDVWDEVVHDVRGRNSGIARTGNGLHRDDAHPAQAESILERLKDEDERRRRAVGGGDDEPFPAAPPPLDLDERRMAGVDLGHEKRHVFIQTMGGGVGADGEPGVGQALLDRSRDIGRESREHETAIEVGLERLNGEAAGGLRHGAGQKPAADLLILRAGRTAGSGQGRQLKPGVAGQNPDEPLPDHARRAQDTYGDFPHGRASSPSSLWRKRTVSAVSESGMQKDTPRSPAA